MAYAPPAALPPPMTFPENLAACTTGAAALAASSTLLPDLRALVVAALGTTPPQPRLDQLVAAMVVSVLGQPPAPPG